MIYKIERCKQCGSKRREPKPEKTSGVCRKCKQPSYYSKKWYYDFHLNGKRYEVAESSDRAITKEAECLKKAEIIKGEAYSPVTWKSGVAELEETYRTLSLKTVEMYQNCVAKLSIQFGSMKLTELTEAHLREYKSQQLDKGGSSSSFNRQRSTLKRIFALSGIDWKFKKSVFTMEKENVRDRVLSREEADGFMEACKEVPYLYTIILVGLDAGLRKQSILSLRWEDISFKDSLITKEGKACKIHRIPMTQRLKNQLIYSRLHQTRLSPYVFPSAKSSSCHMTDIRKSMASALRQAGISGVTMHSLRKTFGTNVVMATGDIAVASDLLGHADISTTRRHYIHLLDGHKQTAIKQLEEATG
ncbi:site-specific integrase [Candidatus Pacearchaeota archaeon]|nr:site-specific integrase [Candidatus Pacearchaeota archaeon]